ncbi:Microtubule-associated protein, microtubule dynamics during spindle orientation [Lunasporangiospora selenospora]|uniref:Microtubule-associated protein, microtubule dynamics during spindle orientation n=1 Tax=Lunasporangiospora selenospora TaxID=979761 RepID=A0A9P6KGU1_9FUNG|nr:Microtubule-associated protein, microtubule dynamics during spindle orientation [Lunasporangiospora selenospora]
MDEFGGNAPEENFNSIPVQERLEHKNWKARVSAYEELAKLFRTSVETSDFRRYAGSLKKIALDSNAVAQESGLTTLIQFVENAPDPNSTKSDVVPAVVEKCLSATRTGTKAKALELILLYVEVDTPDPVIEDVLPGLSAKLPKLVATTTNTLAAIIRTFGVKNVNLKILLKKLPPLFGHSDKNVRAEASALTIELYRWIGKAIVPSLEELKPVQVKELTEAFEKLPAERPTQLKYLRSQQAEMAAAADAAIGADDADGDDGEEDEEEDMEIVDPLDLVDPVDVNAKMESNFYELLASKKWQERKEALDGLLTLCKSPKISDGSYSELVSALGKRMADTNINIVIVAANCLEGLAKGLRESFSRYKSSVAGLIMDRLKERKTNVIEALSGALNAIYSTISYAELLEDTASNAVHKNPQIRAEVIKLQIHRLKDIKISPSKPETKTACDILVKSFDDGDANVREAAAEALGTLMKCCGEKLLAPFTESLDTVKMGKVKEYCEKAVVKAKPAVAPPPKAAPPKVAAKPPAKKPAASAPPAKAAEAPAKKLVAKPSALSSAKKTPVGKAAAPAPAAASAVKKAAPAAGGSKKDDEPIRYKFSNETAEDQAADFLTPELIAEFANSGWKIRLEAMEKLHELVDSNPEFEAELITRVLAKKPGWKESNFQVTTKLYGILQLQAQKLPSFSKACAALTIPAMIDKMGDIKLKKAAGDCLATYAETISLQFVLSQSYDPLKKLKAPKALADSLVWINQQLEDFGITGVQVRELIEFLKVALGSANAAVRTNAVTVLGTLRRFIGPSIRTFVEDCNSALLSAIDAEFAKVADMEPPQVIKGSTEEAGSDGAGAAVEELFPRIDIGNQFTSALLEECGDANWKVRKEGLDKVVAILEANKRIKPNLGGLPGALKLRLSDSNKNLQVLTMEICASLANAMGKPFEKYARILCAGVASCLTDQKDSVRNASIAALDAFATQSGLDALVSPLAVSLVTNSPTLRKDLLVWLTTFCTGAKEKDVTLPDLGPLAPPSLQCLQDRSAEVRKAGQAFLPILISNVGYDTVVSRCNELKGPAKSTVMPIIEAAKPAPPPRPAPVSKPAPERGALNTLPSLPRPGVKAGAKTAVSALPGLKKDVPASGIRPVANVAPPAPAPQPPREQASSPIPALPSLPGPGQGSGLIAPRSRLAPRKPGQPLSLSSESALPGAPSRISRLQDMQSEYDDYSGGAPQTSMGMTQRPYDTMEDVTPSLQSMPGSRLGGLGSLGGINGLGNNGITNSSLSHPTNSIVVPPSAQINRLSVSGVDRRGEAQMDFLVTQITSDEAHQSIDALKQLEKALHGPLDTIIPHINELVNAHTLQIRLAYTGLEQRNNSTTRVCKHLVNSLVSIFSNKELAIKVKSEPLYTLLHELASRLLDKNLDKVESGQQLVKALNVTMVKVLENSNRNATFQALLLILVRCAQQLRNVQDSALQAEFGGLIMKCIWKLTKTIKECVNAGTLKPDQLLQDLNDFLVSIPPPEWKRHGQEGVPLGDMPLRTVKTVLVELSSGMGDDVFNHLGLIQDSSRSAVHQYLVQMTGSKKRRAPSSAQPLSSAQPSSSTQSLSANTARPHIGAMTAQNLAAHNNMLQQQQQPPSHLQGPGLQGPGLQPHVQNPGFQSQISGPGFQPQSSGTVYQSSQFQLSPRFQPLSPRTLQDPGFEASNTHIGSQTSMYGMSHSNIGTGAGDNRNRMSVALSPTLGSQHGGSGEGGDDLTGLTETEMNNRLTQIFTKIGTREETKQGIQDLYEFQKTYPQMESKVNAQLTKTGTFFQNYIRRGLANLEAEANSASASKAGGSSASNAGGMGGIGTSLVRDNIEAAKRRESVMSVTNSEGGISVQSTASANTVDPSESYKDRLSRLQQMFGLPKSESKPGVDTTDSHTTGRVMPDGRNSPSLSMHQRNDLDYQQHQLQQQQILAQHSRSRPTSLYQSSTSPTPSFGTPFQPQSQEGGSFGFNSTTTGYGNGGFTGSMNGAGSSSGTGMMMSTPSLQSLQESMAAKERAQTVALMKERLARMKNQTLTSSQLALQQYHQHQAVNDSNSPSSNNSKAPGQYF